jgi:hypothetical protein
LVPTTAGFLPFTATLPAAAAPKIGVVLCNAFGREAIRAHRL